MLAKLDWYRKGGGVSDRQWRDLLGVLKIQAGSLDRAYLVHWAGELGVEDLHLVGTAELLPPRRARVELSRLAEATFVDFPAGWGVRAAVDHAFAAAGVRRRATIEVADVGTCLQLLQAGLGVALLPPSLLHGDESLANHPVLR